MISLIGGGIGLCFGTLFVYIQSQYGIIPVEGLLVDHYPVSFKWVDLTAIIGMLFIIGSIAAILPTYVILKKIQKLARNRQYISQHQRIYDELISFIQCDTLWASEIDNSPIAVLRKVFKYAPTPNSTPKS